MLCNNVEEINKDDIKILTIEDVMDIVKYNKKNIGRFKKDFYGIKYKDSVLFMTVQSKPDWKTSIICVNPLFAYRNKELKELGELFDIFSKTIEK